MNKRIAMVTGAASGIGKCISERLAAEDIYVLLVDIDHTKGEALAKQLGIDRASFVFCDIQKEEDIQSLFNDILKKYGRLDIVINNAGVIRDNMIWNMSKDDFDLVLGINLRAPWMICKAAAAVMKKQNAGRIVNITSRAWLGNRGQTNYSASKAGIVGMTRALALELGPYNILVNAVAPGLIDTPLTQKLSEEVRTKLIAAQPTKTMGRAEDVAAAVNFLCDLGTQFITGQVLYVDGGKSIGAGV